MDRLGRLTIDHQAKFTLVPERKGTPVPFGEVPEGEPFGDYYAYGVCVGFVKTAPHGGPNRYNAVCRNLSDRRSPLTKWFEATQIVYADI